MKFNALVPEFYVSDYKKSLRFYTKMLDFKVEYERTAPLFGYLSYNGSQLMIQQQETTDQHTGLLEKPYGRGVNFQIMTPDINTIIELLRKNNYSLYKGLNEYWRQCGSELIGSKEIQVHDPDGYLLRFFQYLGNKI